MGPTPQCSIRLTRISDARDDDTKGVDAQGVDCDGRAAVTGWRFGPAVTHHIIENDTSAFKRKTITLPDGRRELRTVRPGFREALAGLRRRLAGHEIDRRRARRRGRSRIRGQPRPAHARPDAAGV